MEPRSAVGLTARDVRLRRDGRLVLDGARLTLLPGTVTALVAPSGAGKSTLLRCLNRLTRADSGTVRLAGRDVATIDPRELRRRVALVVQTPTMLPGTVAENVAYALPRATPGDVEAALRAADLPPAFADRDAAGLSGGERARVAVARALARAPEVLLLDEPTAALDADSAAVIGRTLRRLAEGGLAVCLAVHDLPFARGVADRVVGLDDRELPV
ncbi:ATP-binding cassette domain-containing protein [Patulibacter sp.]|uniref:ABC transporter ATP-binding protein n=1 Tax=Patulibacter sp. TaxID=1912859 RepID=UPI002719ED7E|nr:ATP-binding cassette domain-containing protein [Patulibacter sp.]MDO9407911.1 ATP-binding cassette domain-containing protein [Patulibacter sp.]